MNKFDKERFESAISLWQEWNEKINVISRKDAGNIFEHHILHSLAIAEYVDRKYGGFDKGATVLDLGTGGGFPGIPLAMVYPDVQFVLCDSIGKKVRVAQAVADGLGLRNVTCVNARAESLPEQFDWVVSRAVTSLENFYPWVRGKYREGILYLKGGDINQEISDLLRRFGLKPSSIGTWPIHEWLDDEYFAEKFVIEIGKDYLCPPNSNN